MATFNKLSVASTRDDIISGSGLFPAPNKLTAFDRALARFDAEAGETTSGTEVREVMVSATILKLSYVIGLEARAAATLVVNELAALNMASVILHHDPLDPELQVHLSVFLSVTVQLPFPLQVVFVHTGITGAASFSSYLAFLLASLSSSCFFNVAALSICPFSSTTTGLALLPFPSATCNVADKDFISVTSYDLISSAVIEFT